MKFALKAASGVLASAVITACGSLSTTQLPSGGSLAPNIAAWAGTKSAGLLFETDPGANAVDIFSLPQMRLTQKLTGFKSPTGECSNLDGNIWIGDVLRHEMRMYSSSGNLLVTIKGARLDPYACALDPVSFSLVVTNLDQLKLEPGQIRIYTVRGSPPIILRNPERATYLFPAFDPYGDLWVTGFSASKHPVVAKCGQRSCRTVKLRGGSIFSPGAIAWDTVHGNWIIFDNYCHESATICSYPVSDEGVVGTPTTYLNPAGGALCKLTQAALVQTGNRTIAVVGGDNESSCTGHGNSSADLWANRAGGLPVRSNHDVVAPWGAAVSP